MSIDRFGRPIEYESNPFIDLIGVKPHDILSPDAFTSADAIRLQTAIATVAVTAGLVAGSSFMTKNKVAAHDAHVLDRAPSVMIVGDSLTVGQKGKNYEAMLESAGVEADIFAEGGERYGYAIDVLESNPELVDDADVIIAISSRCFGSTSSVPLVLLSTVSA